MKNPFRSLCLCAFISLLSIGNAWSAPREFSLNLNDAHFRGNTTLMLKKAMSIQYPEIGNKRHQLDYIHLDIADWEKYCAGDKYETNIEIPARCTYYTKDNELVFTQTCGIRLSGIFIRKLPQKSIAVEFSGKRFGSESLQIYDGAAPKGHRGSYYYDDEGTPATTTQCSALW